MFSHLKCDPHSSSEDHGLLAVLTDGAEFGEQLRYLLWGQIFTILEYVFTYVHVPGFILLYCSFEDPYIFHNVTIGGALRWLIP